MPAAATLSASPPQGARQQIEAAIAAALADLGAERTGAAVRRLKALSPGGATAAHRNLIGRVLLAAGAHGEALRWYERALALEPAFGDALVNRADLLAVLGRTDEAAAGYESAYRAGVRDPVACYNQGTSLRDGGRLDAALVAFDRALQLRPVYPDALRAAGLVHKLLGHPDAALQYFDQALRYAPNDADVWLDRANLLHGQDRHAEALATLDAALLHHPNHGRIWNNRGILLHDLGRMPEALASLDAALAHDPESARTRHNLGNVLVRLCRYDDAVTSFDAAIRREPAYAESWASRGLALKLLGRFDEARASFETALQHDSHSIHARANRGELKLLLGDFKTGWADYEFRFFTERQTKPALRTAVPEWDGRARPGARIVVLADQGSGDAIQFSRFLPRLASTGAEVTFVCPPRLQRILRPLTEGITVIDSVGDETAFHYQIALSSMPGVFRTDLASLADSAPYLGAEPDLVRRWNERLGPGGFKVGLCWRGSQNWQCDPNRSIPLATLAPLGGIPGVRLISLQLPDNAETGGVALTIEELGGSLDTGADGFVDTAAVMANLDLVLTCDTSIAHLAGALGRPTWVLLQAVPEWRWMLERTTSPWYPTMRLFRQRRAGDWDGPVAAVAAAITHAERPAVLDL